MSSSSQSEKDSGYGSLGRESQTSGDYASGSRHELFQDRPAPWYTSSTEFEPSADNVTVDSDYIYQAHYERCKYVLTRTLGRAADLLSQLQERNAHWPTHYPMGRAPIRNLRSSNHTPSRHLHLPSNNAEEMIPQFQDGSSRKFVEGLDQSHSKPDHTFSVLQLDLRIASMAGVDVLHSLGRETMASLLDTKITSTIQHLFTLRDRLEDKSSKILITGDLNAGKSTFCNALLRRKVLPEDQQPCTSIFCEVLDARENNNVEEVHAVHKGATYDRNDERTYDFYSVQDLDRVVTEQDRYWQCKVYINRSQGETTLLSNKTVDITLIDAPGLNSDSITTTAVFARQEEIDVVVFVVSAANRFTQSATEFIRQAAHEKAYMFIVVNGFDGIRDKKRCQTAILEQLALLSPQTFKEATELVHFVSSNAVSTSPFLTQSEPGGGGDDDDDDVNNDRNCHNDHNDHGGLPSSCSDPVDDSYQDSDQNSSENPTTQLPIQKKGKVKEKEQDPDFEILEAALRNFVLEKRARSKLTPAMTFLVNCLRDLHVLADSNYDLAQSELDDASERISNIESECHEKSEKAAELSKRMEKEIARTTSDVYRYTRKVLGEEIAVISNIDTPIEYSGLLSAFQFAEALRVDMLSHVSAAIERCEEYGRESTVKGVNMLKTLGIQHLSGSRNDLQFREHMMFRRRKDVLARTIEINVHFLDFFDLKSVWEEKLAYSGMGFTLAGTLGTKVFGKLAWIDRAFSATSIIGSRRLRWVMVSGIVTAAALTLTLIVSKIPQTLPQRIARKVQMALESVDYVHTNASRISSEVQRLLRYPAREVSMGLQKDIGDRIDEKARMENVRLDSEIAIKYFGNLVREVGEVQNGLDTLDLDWALAERDGAQVAFA